MRCFKDGTTTAGIETPRDHSYIANASELLISKMIQPA